MGLKTDKEAPAGEYTGAVREKVLEAKKLWACSDRIAKENNERFRDMELKKNLTSAIALSPAFSVNSKTKVVQKGVYAKMARGEMVRFLAENKIEQPEQMKDFNWRGFVTCAEDII